MDAASEYVIPRDSIFSKARLQPSASQGKFEKPPPSLHHMEPGLHATTSPNRYHPMPASGNMIATEDDFHFIVD